MSISRPTPRRRTSGSCPRPEVRSGRSLPIRTGTVRAGRRMGSGLRFCRRKRADRADFDGAAVSVTGVRKLTEIATEAGGELWSPDGKNILFTSDVYPECADEACNAKKLEAAEKSKVKALIFD